jgi:lactate permease
MTFILAITPILLILVLMVGFRWGAARAGAAGYLSALTIALLFFGAGPVLLAFAHAKAWFLTVDVLFIIWAAFLLYRVADEAGAIRTIGQSLPHLTPDKGMQALIIGWVFATFLQGVGGFGVPVAVISPILVGLGFSPLAAVVIPSVGHGWAVTFGSLGSSFAALMASLPALLLGLLMASVQFLVVTNGFWYIGAFVAGIAGLALSIPLALRSRRSNQNNASLDRRALLIALSGYALLIVITLTIQLIPAVKSLLSGVSIQLNFPETSTSLGYITPAGPGRNLVLFRHTGMILIYTSTLAFIVYKLAGLYKKGSVRSILEGTVRRVMPSSVSIASMVAMAVIMQNSGMTDTIARGLAEGFGALYPIVAPWIGALGAFMTGSNTNSNVVFGELQKRTAELLGYSVPIILAAQTAGAALASVMAPTKVVVGASTAGMGGREGFVMRKLVVYVGLLVTLISVLAIIGVLLTE